MAHNVVSFPGTTKPGQARRINASRLKDARMAQRMNQSELANAIGISRQAISAFELGEKSPEADTMIRNRCRSLLLRTRLFSGSAARDSSVHLDQIRKSAI